MTSGFSAAGGKPQLTAPLVGIDHGQMLTQLGELDNPDNAARLDDLRIAMSITPEGLKQALTQVLQREMAATDESAGNRVLIDALMTDDVEQRNLTAAAQTMLSGSLLKEMQAAQLDEKGLDNIAESKDSVKESRFIGIQTNDMMRFMLSMLRQVMAEINISERRINSMFATLSANMTEKAAESTIREGKEIFKGAIMGFATSIAIVGAGAAFQGRGLSKQNQAVNKHLKPANLDRAQVQTMTRNLHKIDAPAPAKINTGAKPAPTPAPAAPAKANDASNVVMIDGMRVNTGAKPAAVPSPTAAPAKANDASNVVMIDGMRVNIGAKPTPIVTTTPSPVVKTTSAPDMKATSAPDTKPTSAPDTETKLSQASTPTPAEQAVSKQANLKTIQDVSIRAELNGQAYDQKTNKYRTQSSVAEQMTRMSDNAGQLANNSNLSAVKETEADKMIQNSTAEVARGIASDKEKQIERSQEAVKEMRQHISAMRDSTVRTNQSLVKG
ncbi:IpaC/SipC family type III secretion system effector [Yersinia massiliensis]|nr:IpaC/SipC family type III secretion system effector [Yersinia massiliensis]